MLENILNKKESSKPWNPKIYAAFYVCITFLSAHTCIKCICARDLYTYMCNLYTRYTRSCELKKKKMCPSKNSALKKEKKKLYQKLWENSFNSCFWGFFRIWRTLLGLLRPFIFYFLVIVPLIISTLTFTPLLVSILDIHSFCLNQLSTGIPWDGATRTPWSQFGSVELKLGIPPFLGKLNILGYCNVLVPWNSLDGRVPLR